MIDHIILTVSDFERSVAFYAKALKPLGMTNFIDYEGQDGHPDLKGFGDGKRAFFWLKEGKPDPQAVHVGFCSSSARILSSITRPGCSIPTATISRSFIKANGPSRRDS